MHLVCPLQKGWIKIEKIDISSTEMEILDAFILKSKKLRQVCLDFQVLQVTASD